MLAVEVRDRQLFRVSRLTPVSHFNTPFSSYGNRSGRGRPSNIGMNERPS